jgi:hypothetical protein
MFLERRTAKEQQFHLKITDHTVIPKLAPISQAFAEIIQLNFSLQGNMVNILTAQDKVASFLCKLQLYQCIVEADDVPKFSELTLLHEVTKEKCSFTDDVI